MRDTRRDAEEYKQLKHCLQTALEEVARAYTYSIHAQAMRADEARFRDLVGCATSAAKSNLITVEGLLASIGARANIEGEHDGHRYDAGH